MVNSVVHIPYLSEDEKLFLNTTATFSQVRRSSSALDNQCHSTRPSLDNQMNIINRRHQVVSVSSLSFLWKRRGSSSASSLLSTSQSIEFIESDPSHYSTPRSPKARELESLIFEQPQRTVRLSLTPSCAV